MGHFRARARDTRGCVDGKSFENLKLSIDKWGKMVYNVYSEVRKMPIIIGLGVLLLLIQILICFFY